VPSESEVQIAPVWSAIAPPDAKKPTAAKSVAISFDLMLFMCAPI
jgi:hypothetical protein